MLYPGSLHNHDDYSNVRLRDCIIKTTDLIDYSIELGHTCVAITEHECISNHVKAQSYYYKIKEKNPDFKLILGNEIYLVRNELTKENYISGQDRFWHFILLARDLEGHQQIREISTRAWKRSWQQGKMRRVPTYYQDLIDVIDNNKGHVIASTACLGSYPAYLARENKFDELQHWLKQMKKLFGEGNFYLEMQPPAEKNNEQDLYNHSLLEISNKLCIPYIVTTDSHYLKKEDAPIHKAYLNSQDGDREVDEFYATTYMMSTEELESYFKNSDIDLQAAYKNIQSIADSCKDYDLQKELKIPSLEWSEPRTVDISQVWFDRVPYLKTFYTSSFDGDRVLARTVVDKLEQDTRLQNQETYNELNKNLETTWISSEVNKTHWSAYFLNLKRIIERCWEAGTLVGPGRGSGVGFLLLYLLDIIQINPLWEDTKCFDWRFLNPERVSVLDIDTDIEGGKRGEVLDYLRKCYGEDYVANVVTFKTEKSKAAIQTAARGLGIDIDVSMYLSSLIPSDRGQTRTLKECFYGDEDKGFKPIQLFVNAMTNEYPELWKVAQKIEGLVCGIGEHAGGVIFVDEPFTNSTALMRVPNGDLVTQFDLHDCESCSLIKIDLLSVECLDKIHTCLDLICESGLVEQENTLRETYEKVIGIYNLERNNSQMWDMVNEHKIHSLFQMEKQSGIQGISLIHPRNVNDLAVLNSVIRLMASEKGAEQPLNMWARYRKDINQWYREMKDFGLSNEEIDWLSNHSAITDGVCESQEGLMSLVQEPRLGGNSLSFADKCRKGLAKKIGSLFNECEKEFYRNVKEKGCSETLAHYVWDVLLKVQRGYSFNRSHCLAYSLIALQEMNLCFKYPVVLWNCACLITDSGGSESVNKGTDYSKIAQALGKMLHEGISILPIDINNSKYNFTPSIENNSILFGLSGVSNVGGDLAKTIIENRPYISLVDFYHRVNPNRQAMIALIKGGAFDQFCPRMEAMVQYIWMTCDKKKRITLQNMPGLMRYNLLPDGEKYSQARRVYNFNKYLKAECKFNGESYKLDSRAIDFISELGHEDLFVFTETASPIVLINVKLWDKVYQSWMDIFRDWITDNKEQILDDLNTVIFMQDWEKYAKGNISSWEMEALCFYHHDHELINVNNRKYGFVDFFSLPEEPIVDEVFRKGNATIPIFKLFKICGTCIAKNKTKSTVYLLTTSGVVAVKFRQEYFALFDKQTMQRNADGTKTVIEKSWFNRGKMIVVQGIRRGDEFITKKYASSGGHQLYKIDEILENGDLILRSERKQGEEYEDTEE